MSDTITAPVNMLGKRNPDFQPTATVVPIRAGVPLMVLPVNAAPKVTEAPVPAPAVVIGRRKIDPFVPFAYHDESLMIEVPPNPDGDNSNICTLVIRYRGERLELLFGVSMLRRLFDRVTAEHPYHSFTTALDRQDTQISLNYHKYRTGENEWKSWAELTVIRTRLAGKSRRRMRDHIISRAMIRDFNRLDDLIMREP